MKKVMTIVAFLGLLSMLVGLPSAFAVVNGTGWVPANYDTFNRCENETVHVTGMSFDQFAETPDAAGGYHLSYTGKVRGTAYGETTHAGYLISESYTAQFNDPIGDGIIVSLPVFINLNSLDPNVQDMRIRAVFYFMFDANGNLRVDRFLDEAYCHP